MQSLPSEVGRYLASTFLHDRDRLRLACVSRHMHSVASRDRDGIVWDHVLCVAGQQGFAKSPHGYWHVTDHHRPMPRSPSSLSENAADADALGYVAAADPWRFVKCWAWASSYPSPPSRQWKQRCLNSLCMHVDAWHPDVLSALTVVLHCEHPSCPRFCSRVLAAVDMQLMRQAIWHARLDVVKALLENGCVAADMKHGAPLRLALSSIGYENAEADMLPIVDELLRNFADPLRDRMWGIRLCFRRRLHEMAKLLCQYASKLPDGPAALTLLAHDLTVDQADVVLRSLLT